jgi:hypothetical protein
MKIVFFVLHDASKLADLLNAWRAAGASGVTVLFSTGVGRIRREEALRDDLPLMPSLSDFFDRDGDLSRTLFTVVRDQATVKRLAAATRDVVGDLSQPDTGLLVVLPVEQAEGLVKKHG